MFSCLKSNLVKHQSDNNSTSALRRGPTLERVMKVEETWLCGYHSFRSVFKKMKMVEEEVPPSKQQHYSRCYGSTVMVYLHSSNGQRWLLLSFPECWFAFAEVFNPAWTRM